MTVKKQLVPYYNKLRLAYLIKIGLLSFVVMASIIISLLGISKWVMIVSLDQYIKFIILGVTALTFVIAWYFKPSLSSMHKKIDALGFENKIGTYYDYQGKVNPFYEYLEKNLLLHLNKAPLYKTIALSPPKKLSALVLVLVVVLGALLSWETDTSIKSEKLAETIELIDEEQVEILDVLGENLQAEAMNNLEEVVEERLDALKDALKEDDLALAEQELFKMEEALKKAIDKNELPEAIKERLEDIGESISSESPQTLLSALGEMNIKEGALSESDASSDNEDVVGTESETGEAKEGTSSGGESSESEQQGDGT